MRSTLTAVLTVHLNFVQLAPPSGHDRLCNSSDVHYWGGFFWHLLMPPSKPGNDHVHIRITPTVGTNPGNLPHYGLPNSLAPRFWVGYCSCT